jgi:isopenicillin-N epimerase
VRELFLLDESVTYLNHGSFGACPRAVFERYQAWQLELERGPVDFIARRLPGLLDEARAALAAYVGASPAALAFVENATTGVNVAARSLDLRPGDEILATNLEYGACDLAWEWLCERTGARYVRVEVDLDDVAGSLLARRTERTRAVYVSHITSETALVLPVEEIVARADGLVTIVDGAHAPGHVPLDLDALGADFYSGNCHKWLMAPKGAGFLHAPGRRADGPIVSWGYKESPTTLQTRLERQGTRDMAAFLAVPDAIAFVREHGDNERCAALCREARGRLCELLGTEPIAPESMLRQMASVRLPEPDDDLNRRLFEEHRVEIPVMADGELIRISIAPYNDEGDVERLLSALRSAARSRSR